MTLHLTWFAAAQALEGKVPGLEKALEVNLGERFWRPETVRIRGNCCSKRVAPTRRKRIFARSIVLARRMGAKAWEMRATTGLARLLRDTDRHTEAQATLADIYNWFTEGFDTADLKDAKALLGELSSYGQSEMG